MSDLNLWDINSLVKIMYKILWEMSVNATLTRRESVIIHSSFLICFSKVQRIVGLNLWWDVRQFYSNKVSHINACCHLPFNFWKETWNLHLFARNLWPAFIKECELCSYTNHSYIQCNVYCMTWQSILT